ncbi:MAG TPA: sensor domain-containing protein, partial [Thermoanaerobaculia bacterium]|nr:sensor domain-containing protein [Thermoanaerobaculia bacterium]
RVAARVPDLCRGCGGAVETSRAPFRTTGRELIMTERIQHFFKVAARPSTYGNVAYVWLAFPLGIAYFVLLVTGSALSLGLSLLWIGLAIMLAFVLSIRGLGDFERLLSKWLLGESLTARAWPARSQRFFPWLGSILKDSTTWKGALFLLVKFPVGILCWVVSVATFAVSAAFLLAPLDHGGRLYIADWTLHDPTGGFLISAFGALLLIATLHLHNAMGALWRFMGRQLLTTSAAVV